MGFNLLLPFAILLVIVIVIFVFSGVKIVQPYEQAIYMRLGKFVRVLDQGLNFVCPLINQVVKLDLRTEVMDVPKQEVITKDNSPVNVDAVIYIKVTDPRKAFFEVTNYRLATVNLAQTTLRSVIGQMELDEILSNRDNDLRHYPAFTSKAECNRFLASIGRYGFPIIEGDLRTLLDSLDSHEALAALGVVIDPHSESPIAIDPGVRIGKGIKG